MNYGKRGVSRQKKLLNSSTRKVGTKIGVTAFKIFLICIVTIIVGGTCAVLGMVKGIIDSSPDISEVDVTPTGYATKIYYNSGNEAQTLVASGSNRVQKTIDQIPLMLQRCFIAVEDARFYEHNGIDMKGIMRAAMIAVTNRELSEGASTITQQLLKNNVFKAFNESTSEKIKRKIQEQYLALKLETIMSKDTILENYLNTINLGNGYLGVQSAANGYFGKDVSELTLSECAIIASVTQNPVGLNPLKHPEANQERQHKVLNDMYDQGYISEAEHAEALADVGVYSRIQDLHPEEVNFTYSYFVDELIDQLTEDLVTQKGYTEVQATNLIYRGGLSVFSTQDESMQAIADSVINDPAWYKNGTEFSITYALSVQKADGKTIHYSHQTLQRYFQTVGGKANFKLTYSDEEVARGYVEEYKTAMVQEGDTVLGEVLSFTIQPQLSFTLMDQHTGYVKVLLGGRGDKIGSRTLNRSTGAPRLPGSSIKPLAVYGPALDTGSITLATAIDDAPFYYSGAEAQLVNNYEKNYMGMMTVRTALRDSRNVPAVKVLTDITPQLGFNYLTKFGISTLVDSKQAVNGYHDIVQSLALGGMTKGVSSIDMTAAYAAIANKGVYTKPVYYTQVFDHDGNLILDNTQPETHPVLKETTAWLLNSAMLDVVRAGTGGGARMSTQPVAGKTGTTNSDGDKWFCGYTPYYTASIWMGYDDNSTLTYRNPSHTAMWAAIMNPIHEGLETGSYDRPDGIVEVQVCAQSGKLPIAGTCDCDPRGSQIITEYFSADNVPTDFCDTHVKLRICNDTNEIASPYCKNVTEKILVKKEPPNVLNPEDAGKYPVKDDEYSIMSDMLDKICTRHKPSTNIPQPTTSPSNPTDPANPAATAGAATNPRR